MVNLVSFGLEQLSYHKAGTHTHTQQFIRVSKTIPKKRHKNTAEKIKAKDEENLIKNIQFDYT